ncbi:putative ATPase/DNA-binding SARP family transcriptional activator [Thermocatellispora tengchongensis]|uniref:Putative ATPase/DNA-binding SARP family transcriptional activator n=1 Tax=Thermocatellispora tengchongensis TaxID=1073253 RepID=A0A840PGM2_9ACTN|nr:BTAD domain-containing putative transcriptional regulator [Thermocatellispora tengchongensis]MBB5140564.1 putative ATPase/DNA-binding SARP family transcriptional activator [Thermocatellispora tengchongensis]
MIGSREAGTAGGVRVRLLGGVRATGDRGEPLDVGPAKCQAVLAALALSAGAAVPAWRLVELVWGEDPPRTAGRTLQSYIARLRRGLGAGAIARIGGAYRLDVPPDAVDVVRFQRLLDAGELDAALAEWTGYPLAGLAVPGMAAAVDGMVERWLSAVEADLEGRVRTDPAAAVGPLTELTAGHPFREGLWALLMTALYRAGRQADALAAYRTARRALAEHLGVEPGPRLRELESSILGHDERLRAPAPRPREAGLPAGTVTFGFCEVEGRGRWTSAGPAESVEAATARHGGHLFAIGGDSFGAAFHRAADAVAWAEDLRASGSGPRLRIGLHTGEPERRGQGYFGPAVHQAACLAAAGHGGQILVSAATAALLDRDDLRDLGAYRLDGVAARQRVFQVDDGGHPPLRAGDGRRGNLPLRQGRLIGRDADLEAVGRALAGHPVVTLVGPGGIGKTRLAVAAARRGDFDDGAWLIDLAEIASSGDVPRAVAGALGIKESAGRIRTESVVTALRPRRALVVLDNCEHVIDGAAALAQAVAEGCPDVQVLATSREGLGLGHGLERLIAVAPLGIGAGVELFTERASAVSSVFAPEAGREDVAEICRRLEGVPLAIELAATRTVSLSPAELLAGLDDRLRLLVGGRRTGAGRHRTLRATVQWSYDLLGPAERSLFQRLSVFAGPFGLAAARAVAAGETGETDLVLDALVARSMVVVEPGPSGRRFRLLETMRQFAAERLAESGQAGVIAGRHTRWCLDEVTRVHRLLTGPAEAEGVARVEELWPNLRAAFGRACAEGDARLAYALVRPVVAEVVLRARAEIGDWAERVLALAPPKDEELRIFGLVWAAQRYKLARDPAAYERLAARHGEPADPRVRQARASLYDDHRGLVTWGPAAAAELRRRGEHDLAVRVELDTASGVVFQGRLAEGDALVSALVERFRAEGPPTLLNWALMLLGYSASFQGDRERAERLFGEAVAVELPERTFSPNKAVEARVLFRRGERRRAFRLLRAQVEDLLDTDNLYATCVASVEFVTMMAALGRLSDGARILAYLSSGLLDVPVWRTQVADARARIAAGLGRVPDEEPDPDGRRALEHMRAVLHELA